MSTHKNNVRKMLDEEKKKGVDLCEKFGVDLYNSDSLIICSVDVCVTTRCNLRCVNCIHCIPEYAKHGIKTADVPLETIKRDITKLSQSVDYIFRAVILGGEALLYKDLAKVIRFCASLPNVGVIRIPTNATIMPDDDVFKALKDTGSYLSVNHYVGSDRALVRAIDEKAVELGVHNGILKEFARGWDAFTPFDGKLLRSGTDVEKAFAECRITRDNFMMNGKFTVCANNYHSQEIGLIPRCDDALDTLDIHSYTSSELRQKLKDFYDKKFFHACMYCSMPTAALTKVPAGLQPRGVEKEHLSVGYFVLDGLQLLYACINNFYLKVSAQMYTTANLRIDYDKLAKLFDIHQEERTTVSYERAYIFKGAVYGGFLPAIIDSSDEKFYLAEGEHSFFNALFEKSSSEELLELCATLNALFEYKHDATMKYLIVMQNEQSRLYDVMSELRNSHSGQFFVKPHPKRDMKMETASKLGVTLIPGRVPFELVCMNIKVHGQSVVLYNQQGEKLDWQDTLFKDV